MFYLILATGLLSFSAIAWAMCSNSKHRDREEKRILYMTGRKWNNGKVGPK